eukprot:320083-Chlamydomonas_euryale.AAC.8
MIIDSNNRVATGLAACADSDGRTGAERSVAAAECSGSCAGGRGAEEGEESGQVRVLTCFGRAQNRATRPSGKRWVKAGGDGVQDGCRWSEGRVKGRGVGGAAGIRTW